MIVLFIIVVNKEMKLNFSLPWILVYLEYYSNKELLKIRNIDKYDFKKRYNRDFSRKLWYFAILRGLLRISRFIAENSKFRDFSR